MYHNPSCSKSRGALEILREQGIETDVVEYLKAPPDRATLERIVDAIPNPPAELVRKDKRFKELGLDAADYTEPRRGRRAPARPPRADGASGGLPGRTRRDRAPVGDRARAALTPKETRWL